MKVRGLFFLTYIPDFFGYRTLLCVLILVCVVGTYCVKSSFGVKVEDFYKKNQFKFT